MEDNINAVQPEPLRNMREHQGDDIDGLIEVRRSKVHGLGVFAKRALPAGAEIGIYEGRRYSLQQAKRIEWDASLTYLFELSDGTYIDGRQGGNETRHLNHACQPNCEAFEDALPDGMLTIRFRTTRAVAAGEELFLDYQLNLEEQDDLAPYRCRCGTPVCRGTLGDR